MRKRSIFIWIGVFVAFGLWLSTDPDLGLFQNLPFGASLVSLITILVSAIPWLIVLHLARKAIFDYEIADFRKLLEAAVDSPTGAGLAALALAMGFVAISIVVAAVAVSS